MGYKSYKSYKNYKKYKNHSNEQFQKVNNDTFGPYGDGHVHSAGSTDALYSVDGLVNRAKKLGLNFLSITDHNNLDYVLEFLTRNELSKIKPYHQWDSLKFVPGVEVTCRIDGKDGINHKGNPSKVHLLVYSPIMTKDIPFVKLMELKHANDIAYDFGNIINVAKSQEILLDEKDVRTFIERKRDQVEGFSTIDRESMWEFFSKYYSGVFKSRKQLFNACSKIPQATRLNLDAKEVMDFAHDAGGICVLAHPQVSIDRMSKPEKALDVLIDGGIDGFEMNCPSMRNEGYDLVKRACGRHNSKNPIIFTSGTDYHRRVDWRDLGWFKDYITKEVKYLSESGVSTFLKELGNLDEVRNLGCDSHRRYDKAPRLALQDRLEDIKTFVEENKYWERKYPIFDTVLTSGIPEFEKQIILWTTKNTNT